MKNIRIEFTLLWESLPSGLKSTLIAIGGLGVAVAILFVGKLALPSADFSAAEGALAAAFGAVVVSLTKDKFKDV